MEPRSASARHLPLLLALSVQWDDCSVALGTAEAWTVEVWSQQPERALASPAGAATAAATHSGPLASRDALLLLDRLLLRTDTALSAVDRLCFAHGPGAFTSLRVAAGLVHGLSIAIGKPIAGVCSLAAMAAHAPGWRTGTRWLQVSAIDARMGECYYSVHACQGGHYPRPLAAPAVGSADAAVSLFEQVLAQQVGGVGEGGVTLVGNAFGQSPQLAEWARRRGFDPERFSGRSSDAAAVLAVAASIGAPPGGAAELTLPIYVREKIALDRDEQRVRAAARQ